jgi:cystathionine beta-lyase
MGLKFHFVDLSKVENMIAYITPKTKLLWLETPSNPLMRVIDIAACVAQAKKHAIQVAVDNTFASPYLQNPLDLGVDIVMHSVTKYLGGHSDVIMGALVVNDEQLYKDLAFIANSCGAVPGPQDSFLVLRGIKTLHLRMERHCFNGKKVAEFLRHHPKVGKVYWPGFADHPNHEVAKKQMRDFGGMLSFTLKNDSIENAIMLMESVEVFSLAESLGGVESLINHPASMTHASIPREERIKNGLSDSLIRLSVGVEDVEDLIADLERALLIC